MPATISSVEGVIISDSRGVPTLSVTVKGSDGSSGTFSVPSGASTGVHEAHELRDDNTAHSGVTKALSLLKSDIEPVLAGKNLYSQEEIDETLIKLDGTLNKERLGGNTMIGVSVAALKAAAASRGKEVWQHLHDEYFINRKAEFPRLYANLINGGKHADTKLAFQEYHVVPKMTDMEEASSLILRIQEHLGGIIIREFGPVRKGDEGGFALPSSDIEKPLLLFRNAVYELGVQDKVDFALDVAASSFYDLSKHEYVAGDRTYDTDALMNVYARYSEKYNLISIEDPFYEEDFASFASLRNSVSGTLRVGDDLTTTNRERLARAVREGSVDAVIIKPNQIGTLTETIATMKYAEENGIKCIISHRSGETEDSFIADLAYASAAFGLKLGARGPKEREAKYGRLLAIKESK